jgi:hypothetical protein
MRLRSSEIWTIESQIEGGRKHSGIVVLSSGKLVGGDRQYLYVGRYRFREGRIAAYINVVHYEGEAYSVFNRWEDRFAVRFVGLRHGDIIHGEMLRKDLPRTKLPAQMVWRSSVAPQLPGQPSRKRSEPKRVGKSR